jgi:hypothetical protein
MASFLHGVLLLYLLLFEQMTFRLCRSAWTSNHFLVLLYLNKDPCPYSLLGKDKSCYRTTAKDSPLSRAPRASRQSWAY